MNSILDNRRFPLEARMRQLVFFLLSLFPLALDAQQTNPLVNSTLDGLVIDALTKEPLVGASLQLEGVTHSTKSDGQGRFRFVTGQKFPYTIIVSYVGYHTKQVVADGSPITIELDPDATGLDEVVVVGYSQVRKSSQTSSITTLSENDFSKASYTSITEKLQGQAPGLAISSNSGVPGSSVLVRLRGATSINAGNDPLYVVDGVFINNESLQAISMGGQTTNPLSDLNPADIESVEVLKDASATAVYGARGANGVILITTKRGKRNSPSRFNLTVDNGLGKATNLWELVTGPEHAELVNLVHLNDGKSFETRPFRSRGEVIPGFPAYGLPEEQHTYDRVSDVFRVAHTQNYNLSLSGGDERTNFYLGGEYQNQKSTLKVQDFERSSFRANLDHSFSDRFKIGASNSIANAPRRLVRVGDGPAGLFQAALHTPTFYPYYNEDGSYSKPTVFDNHIAILENSDTYSNSLRTINNLYASFQVTPELSFKSTVGVDYNNYHEVAYYNTNLVYGQPAGEANDVRTTRSTIMAEQLLNYSLFRERQDISVFLGNSVQFTQNAREDITGNGFPSDQFKRIASAAIQTASTTGSDYGLVSFFAGANYTFNKRYIVNANFRADGSSRFGSENRWGYFPSLALGWNISNEPFFPSSDVLDNLRVRSSYGLTGNQDIDDFASRGLWSGGRNYGAAPGIGPSQLANPNLKWETTTQFDIGVSAALFNQRLTVELDYYHKYTRDLLIDEPVPSKTGYSSVFRNVGEVSNRGVELLVKAATIERDAFKWNTTFTISQNRNRIEKLNAPINGGYMFRLEQGHALYSVWVYNYLGVDPETGNIRIEDLDGNGQITEADRKIVGNAWPDFEGAFRNTFNYRNFDLNFNLTYRYGNKLYNYTAYFLETSGTRGVTRSIQKSSLNYWKQPGDTDVLPRPTSLQNEDGSRNYTPNLSRFYEDASFIRLKDVTLGYTLPRNVLSSVGIHSFRVYLTGTNLLTFTKYRGPDPETNARADQLQVQGLDFNGTPQTKAINIGVNLTF